MLFKSLIKNYFYLIIRVPIICTAFIVPNLKSYFILNLLIMVAFLSPYFNLIIILSFLKKELQGDIGIFSG
jgi:hypothetical protein